MQIKFSNGKTFTYTNCISIDEDYINGNTRKSLEVEMPLAQTSFDEIYSILKDENAVKHIELVGDEQQIPIYKEVKISATADNGEKVTITKVAEDDKGDPIVESYDKYTPQSEHDNFTIMGKITVDNDKIIFKLYKLSDVEIERNSAISAVDELLLSMAESEA